LTELRRTYSLFARALPLRYDRDALARYGLTAASAAQQVSTALGGQVVGQVRDGLRVHDLVVRLVPEERRSRADIENLILRGSTGALLRLRDVARVEPDDAPYLIARQDGRRKAVISANVAEGHNLGHVIAAVREAVDPIAVENGVSVQYGGQFEAQQSASRSLALTGGAILLLVLMLLNVSIGSFRGALLVALNLPLALIGGIAAVFISESADSRRAACMPIRPCRKVPKRRRLRW
jgi:cobalt-zinc-cadmium resistance protein CzcA